MEKIEFRAANWNRKEAIGELIKFIATAPKLDECSIIGQTNNTRIELQRQKDKKGKRGYVKAIQRYNKVVIYEVETELT